MSANYKLLAQTKSILVDVPGGLLKPYRAPELREFGDLRTQTLGGSPGVGDSQGGLFGALDMPDFKPDDFPLIKP
jgi:hypothetical protein